MQYTAETKDDVVVNIDGNNKHIIAFTHFLFKIQFSTPNSFQVIGEVNNYFYLDCQPFNEEQTKKILL